MKANKALKRLNKIEALLSNVTKRYSASAPEIRHVLQNAKAAVTRAKETVSLQASSKRAKNPPVKQSEPTSKFTPEPSKPKRKLSAAGRKAIIAATKRRWALKRAEAANTATKIAAPARKKAAIKKAALKSPSARAAKTSAPAKKVAAKQTAPAVAQTVTTPTT
jgi:DNA-binding protein HU-beta